MEIKGMVYLVGAGPGAPGLLTIRGMELLKHCEAVVYDHLASERFLDYVPAGARRVYVGKQAGRHSMRQEDINRILAELAMEGRRVVRLKGGDPFVFGRGGEEALALDALGIPYEVVPGVTSAVAAPESAGIPVTHRGVSRSFHVVTGHTKDGEDCLPPNFEVYGALSGTLVFLMGLNHLPDIVEKLIAGGKNPDTPAAVIENGTLPEQRAVRAPLAGLEARVREAGIRTPAIIIVGPVASYEMKCSALYPLSGVRAGVVGTRQFAEKLCAALEREGAKARWIYHMEVESCLEQEAVRNVYRNLKQYGWIVFTSANGVRLFFKGLLMFGLDLRALGHVKFAVIGDGTREALAGYGFLADYMPELYCAQALAQGLTERLPEGDGKKERLLIARSKGGSPLLTHILYQAGLAFDDVVFYQVAGRAAVKDLGELPDYLVFASASGVRAFFEEYPNLAEKERGAGAAIACIGDVTAKALEDIAGCKAQVVAQSYNVEGLVRAIEDDARLRGRAGAANV